ncbi:hypothetical protein GCK32_010475 [Trichostrongylus colubriformis]|uniref:Uncharacterized protein n=1 Tax=Trichostrongylus colubriformis TaxID=6319 RepID=A0AAN8IJA6_TRICO
MSMDFKALSVSIYLRVPRRNTERSCQSGSTPADGIELLEDLKTQLSDTAIDIPRKQKKDVVNKRTNRRGGILKKIVGTRKRTPFATPQGSTLEDTTTQLSEQISPAPIATTSKEASKEGQKTPENPSNTKSRESSKNSTPQLEKDRSRSPDDEKSPRKKWKIVMKRKQPKSTEGKSSGECAKEVKKRWWQFW